MRDDLFALFKAAVLAPRDVSKHDAHLPVPIPSRIRKAGKVQPSGSKLSRMAAAGALTLRGRVRSRLRSRP